MKIEQLISKKKQEKPLLESEINFIVKGFLSGEISKQQMANFLHAVVEKDLTKKETFYLTKAMLNSGEIYDLSNFDNTIDKHSTGGVSDSTTLIVVPLFACFGYTCIKMSGGALGHTGGTADKLKVFKGINLTPTSQEINLIAKSTGACFITSSSAIAPADNKIYALRDEINAMSTALIASSIMSKKLATGNKNLVLDVKFGSGALAAKKRDAKRLAKLMQQIGTNYGVNTSFILGNMNQPLGKAIGNTAEIYEVLANLQTAARTPLLHHSMRIVATALYKQLKMPKRQVYKQAYHMVQNGSVLKKLKQIVTAQGGEFVNTFVLKPQGFVESDKQIKIKKINTKALGLIDKQLNKQLGDNYKGFKILVEVGQKVKKGQKVFQLYFKPENKKQLTKQLLETLNSK